MIGYAREDINGCLNNSRDILFKVVEADFLREEGKNEEAQKVLDGINGRELRYRSAVAYSYFLYVNALCRQDEHYTEYVRDSIQFYEFHNFGPGAKSNQRVNFSNELSPEEAVFYKKEKVLGNWDPN